MIAAGQEVVGTALLAGLLVLRVGLAVYALASGVLKGHRSEPGVPPCPDRQPETSGQRSRRPVRRGRLRAHWRRASSRWRW